MKRHYRFTHRSLESGMVRLEWARGLFAKPDPLDFWIVPAGEIEQAKARVRAGEFD